MKDRDLRIHHHLKHPLWKENPQKAKELLEKEIETRREYLHEVMEYSKGFFGSVQAVDQRELMLVIEILYGIH